MKLHVFTLLVCTSVFATAETPAKAGTSNQATANGLCSVSNTGSNNTITIRCETNQAQASKMVQILNKILANQLDSAKVMGALDELLARPSGIQQWSGGPNSPNIVGSGNQVTYSDTSQLPILSEKQISDLKASLSSTQFKLIMHYSGSDSEAAVLAEDLRKAAIAEGWTADWEAGFGGSPGQTVPIVIGVNNSETAKKAGPLAVLVALRQLAGYPVPGVIEPSIPDGEVDVFLSSRPLHRPQ
jgi:hypothetical protein